MTTTKIIIEIEISTNSTTSIQSENPIFFSKLQSKVLEMIHRRVRRFSRWTSSGNRLGLKTSTSITEHSS